MKICFFFQNFNLFLQNPNSDGKKLLSDLRNLNGHLEVMETPFLTGSTLAYADCVLLPKLQHIRLAGEVIKSINLYMLKYYKFEFKSKKYACWTDIYNSTIKGSCWVVKFRVYLECCISKDTSLFCLGWYHSPYKYVLTGIGKILVYQLSC